MSTVKFDSRRNKPHLSNECKTVLSACACCIFVYTYLRMYVYIIKEYIVLAVAIGN